MHHIHTHIYIHIHALTTIITYCNWNCTSKSSSVIISSQIDRKNSKEVARCHLGCNLGDAATYPSYPTVNIPNMWMFIHIFLYLFAQLPMFTLG